MLKFHVHLKVKSEIGLQLCKTWIITRTLTGLHKVLEEKLMSLKEKFKLLHTKVV